MDGPGPCRTSTTHGERELAAKRGRAAGRQIEVVTSVYPFTAPAG